MPGAILQINMIIADKTIINTVAVIAYDCINKSHIHVAPSCKLSGSIHVQSSTHIGTGEIVVKNIQNHLKVIGVPAKEVK